MSIFLSVLFAGGLFGGILVCMRIGWRIGQRRLAEQGESAHAGLGAVEGSIFGLIGLLIAFTFTGAAARFDARRQLIVEHINAMGTAWLRLDLLDDPARAGMQDLFRRYVDTQLELSRRPADLKTWEAGLAQLASLQNQIWTRALTAAKAEKSQPVAMLLLPAINQMIDMAGTRQLAARLHPHPAIYIMMGLLVLVGALMAGFAMAKTTQQSRLHLFGFAIVISLSVYLILDLEFPRLGLIRVDSFDQAVVELRASMDPVSPPANKPGP